MWILFSIIAGLGDALRDSGSKWLSNAAPRDMVSWSYSALALPYLVPMMLAHWPDELHWSFWPLILTVSLLHVGGGIMLVKALQTSELSLCAPIVAFTPVFLLVVAPLLTGDAPSSVGVYGTLLVVLGCYLLNIGELKRGLLAPIAALAKDSGVRLMLVLSILWSVTGSIDRIAVQRFDMEFWGCAQLTLISILFLPVVLWRGALRVQLKASTWGKLALVGAVNALSFVTYLVALKTAPVFYVVCLKRSSIIFSVIIGAVFFGERNTPGRLIGGALMIAGITIISVWG